MTHPIQNFQSDVSASLQDDILHLARDLDRMKAQGGSFDVMDAIAQDISHVAGKMADEYKGRDDWEGGSAHKALTDLHHAAAGWEVDGPFEPMVTICIYASALADGPAPIAYDRMLAAEGKVNNIAGVARKAKVQSGKVAQRRNALRRIVGTPAGFKGVTAMAKDDPTIEARVCQLYGLEAFRDMPANSKDRKKLVRDLDENLEGKRLDSARITHLIG